MKIAFVHNFVTHYTKKTFELLSCKYNIKYYFFSKGKEKFWLSNNGIKIPKTNHQYLSGIQVCNTRITPTLPFKLFFSKVDIYFSSIDGKFALLTVFFISLIKMKPFILWTGIWMRIQTPFHRLIFPFIKYIYNHADAIVVYGNHVKNYLISEGIKCEKIFIAPHATENKLYNRIVSVYEKNMLRKKLDIPDSSQVILYVGRFDHSKGLDILLYAFAKLKKDDVYLILGGDGFLFERLISLVKKLNIESRVIFPGYIKNNEIVLYYAISYVYVLSSITTNTFKEPWGFVVNEAFNQGVPVIATDAVGAAEGGLIENGINGLIVREKNIDDLYQAILKVIKNEELRNQMSQNAKNKISKWTQENMIVGFENAINYVNQFHLTNK